MAETTTTSALAVSSQSNSDEALAKLGTPPSWVAISAEDWGAMPLEDRLITLQFFRAEIKETTAGLMTLRFPTIPFPASGTLFWQVPAATPEKPDNVDPLRTLDLIVILKQPGRAYWKSRGGDRGTKGTPPDCKSPDGITPNVQNPVSKSCLTCPMAQFGTAVNDKGEPGRGQACRASLNIFGLMQGQEIPTHVKLPPTSVGIFENFCVGLAKRNIPLVSVYASLGLKVEQNAAGDKFTVVAPSVASAKLDFATMRKARDIEKLYHAKMVERGAEASAEDDIAAEQERQRRDAAGGVIDGKAQVVTGDEPPPRTDEDIPF
jgi:hypothetical protein